MSEDKNCRVPPAPPSEGRQPPIDFIGDWDSIVVEHRQIGYQENGFRVWLTEVQITKLIEDRNRLRNAPGYERPDVPYFRAHEEYPDLLIRRLNGIEQIGVLLTDGAFLRVDDLSNYPTYAEIRDEL